MNGGKKVAITMMISFLLINNQRVSIWFPSFDKLSTLALDVGKFIQLDNDDDDDERLLFFCILN